VQQETEGTGKSSVSTLTTSVPSRATASQRARFPIRLRGEHVDQLEHQQAGQQAGQQLQGQCQQQPP
jgi:hypothetical protein